MALHGGPAAPAVDIDLILAAADRLDIVAGSVRAVAGRDTALVPAAELLRAVAGTHDHYRDCCCAEAVTATTFARAVLAGGAP